VSEMIYQLCLAVTRSQKRKILLTIDIISMVAAFYISLALTNGALKGMGPDLAHAKIIAAIISAGVAMTFLFGLHRIKLIAYELQSVVETAVVATAMGFAGAFVNYATEAGLPMQVFVSLAMIFILLSASVRLAMRKTLQWIYFRGRPRKRLLIYGAGQTGQQLVAALHLDNEVEAYAFIDDNATLWAQSVAGLKVFSSTKISGIIADNQIELVVLAMPSASAQVRARISRQLREIGCDVHELPSFAELVVEGEIIKKSEPVELSSFLGRSRLEDQLPGVCDAYQNRRILVTGAGGSIGSELCRQILSCEPACLILLDHSEHALYNIQREITEIAPDLEVAAVLGSIMEPTLMQETLEKFGVDVVLHAAAYKHLPMVEDNAIEGMRINVLGTKIVAEAARKANVERLILVSSDKAVRPTSVMGSSKRLAELVIQDLATRSDRTRFSMVRFGNVLGSSGSVIPLFEDQIARGGPVTLTHPKVTRYFMTVSEAVRLVLLAGSFARGGDVFVLDMGKPVPIHKVARQMIESSGYNVRDEDNPNGDIEIQITGLRPGEKLHEELLIGSDMLTTPHSKILRAQESCLSEIEMANALQDIRKAIDLRDQSALRYALEKWVEDAHVDESLQEQIN